MSKKSVEEGITGTGVVDLNENELDQAFGGALRTYWETRRTKEGETAKVKSNPALDFPHDFQP